MASGTKLRECTIYVTDSAPVGGEVRETVAAWTAAGVVGPSLWVTPEDIVEAQGLPPQVTATELRGDEQSRVDLFTAIGTQVLDKVRVVAAQLITADTPVATDVVSAANTVVRAVDDALPRSVGDGVESRSTNLRKLNIMIPVSGASHASDSLVLPGWDANVVISPEDRPDLDRSTVYVRYPGNFVGHAGAALCAVGGLLSGMRTGALDHLELDSTVHDDDVFVARFTVRSVVGEDIVDDLADATLDLDAFGPEGPATLIPGSRVAGNPRDIAHRAATHVLGTPAWQAQAEMQVEQPRDHYASLPSVFRHAVGFNARMFGVMGRWMLSRLKLSVERSATRVLVGENGGIDVRIDAAPAQSIADSAEDYLRGVEAEHQRALSSPQQDLVHLNPAAWTTMREMATSLIDGSDLPAGMPEPRSSGRRELLPREAVVPDTADVWQGLDGMRIESLDVRSAAQYTQHVDARVAEVEGECAQLTSQRNATRDEMASVEGELQELREKLEAAKAEESDGVEADESGSESEKKVTAKAPGAKKVAKLTGSVRKVEAKLARLESKLHEIETKLAEVADELSVLKDEKLKFAEWLRSKDSYVRYLLVDLTERRAYLTQDEQREDSEPRVPPRERLMKRQKVVRVIWVLALALGAIALGVSLFLGWRAGHTWTQLLTYAGITIGVVLLVLVASNHLFYRAVRRYETQLARDIAAQRAATERALWCKGQIARLEAQETAMTDWGYILSDIVHRPWNRVPKAPREMSDAVVEALPASMGVAGIDRNVDLPFQSTAAAARAVYVKGWLGHALETIVRDFDSVEIDGDSGFSSVEADTSDRETGPRRRFLRFLEDPKSRQSATEAAEQRFRTGVDSQEIPIPTRTVERRGPYSNHQHIAEPNYFAAVAGEGIAFAGDVFTASGRQRLAHYVDRSAAWLPANVHMGPNAPAMKIEAADGANAVRIDLSRRLDLNDLVLFSSVRANRAETQELRVAERRREHESAPADGVDWY